MPTNKERADRGWSIFQYYREHCSYEGEPDKDIIPDVLADLMHHCDQSDPHISFDDALRVASMHHDTEVLEESACPDCGTPRTGDVCDECLDNTESTCQNCSSQFKDDDLLPVKNILDRLQPGDIFPSGECPKCGCFCIPNPR